MASTKGSQPTGDEHYRVVINDEGMYSIWTEHRALPEGWYEEGMAGTRDECLQHIERVWADMRPLSLRRAMGEVR